MDPFLILRFLFLSCFSPVSAKLSAWSRALSEKLKGPQLVVKKFPRILSKLTVHYRVHNRPPLSLTWARAIQPMPPSYFPKIHFNIIPTYTPRSPKWNFPVSGTMRQISCPFSTGVVQYQRMSPSPRPCHLFRNVCSYDELLVAPRPNPKLEDRPLSAVRDCLFYIFAATFHIWRPFLEPQPADPLFCGDGGPLTVSAYLFQIPLRLYLSNPVTAHRYISYWRHKSLKIYVNKLSWTLTVSVLLIFCVQTGTEL
jgi:hypothetical protein